MSKNTINIRGDLLKKRLEITTGKTLYELSEENGFSRNFLSEACRSGRASPIVQAVVRKYGIEPSIFCEVKKEFKQMTIEEIGSDLISREDINTFIENTSTVLSDMGKSINDLNEATTELFNKFVDDWNKAFQEYEYALNKLLEEIK